jgi:hypothetical protein
MSDKIQEFIDGITEQGCCSDCCGASIVMGDLCSECLEHCDSINEEDDE